MTTQFARDAWDANAEIWEARMGIRAYDHLKKPGSKVANFAWSQRIKSPRLVEAANA